MNLPKKYRIIVHLFYYEDYSTREIADMLKLKEPTVRTRLLRARKLLKERLSDVSTEERVKSYIRKSFRSFTLRRQSSGRKKR